MTKKKVKKVNSKAPIVIRRPHKFYHYAFFRAALVALGLIVIAFIFNLHFFNQSQSSESDTPTAQTSIIYDTPTPYKINVKYGTFNSSQLGISFEYPNNLTPKVIGNKVFLFGGNYNGSDQDFLDNYSYYYHVEVFQKATGESLEDAIKSQFLNGPFFSDCRISINTLNTKYQVNYEKLTVSGPPRQSQNDPVGNCATNYSSYGYFMMNPEKADKFVFVRLAQDEPMVEDGIGWDQTIKIF